MNNYNISSSPEKVGNTVMVFSLKRKSQTNSQRKTSHNPGTSKAVIPKTRQLLKQAWVYVV